MANLQRSWASPSGRLSSSCRICASLRVSQCAWASTSLATLLAGFLLHGQSGEHFRQSRPPLTASADEDSHSLWTDLRSPLQSAARENDSNQTKKIDQLAQHPFLKKSRDKLSVQNRPGQLLQHILTNNVQIGTQATTNQPSIFSQIKRTIPEIECPFIRR